MALFWVAGVDLEFFVTQPPRSNEIDELTLNHEAGDLLGQVMIWVLHLTGLV
jgi:hypothetical protein